MLKRFVPLALLASLAVFVGYAAATPIAVDDMLTLVNKERQQKGLAAVVVLPALTQLAQSHADRMAQTKQMMPRFPDETQLIQRIVSAAPQLQWTMSRINVGTGSTAAAVVKMFMGSEQTSANMLSESTHCGFGASAGDNGQTYWAQIFAHGQAAAPASQTSAESISSASPNTVTSSTPSQTPSLNTDSSSAAPSTATQTTTAPSTTASPTTTPSTTPSSTAPSTTPSTAAPSTTTPITAVPSTVLPTTPLPPTPTVSPVSTPPKSPASASTSATTHTPPKSTTPVQADSPLKRPWE
ncbi:hypothetical protein THASP1DRAFT_28125 [Thamnocephalis sphaerospora]|uniref:SCP domain-containing protein n=1 Tax=Thamnocephalis sphaerospora TaxID=78915 RepID=A0A4P9XXA5_9FUNG|nr:hypothetical protein THASP1DRAFT_28125 [Thamnocephalis sphaerospora]|eukprot:RKP10080.1 hypothetical protein THASP1DRAFT_28125 [Thamnocephalis sphaerospora]